MAKFSIELQGRSEKLADCRPVKGIEILGVYHELDYQLSFQKRTQVSHLSQVSSKENQAVQINLTPIREHGIMARPPSPFTTRLWVLQAISVIVTDMSSSFACFLQIKIAHFLVHYGDLGK